jgi:uncharacterized integral membrane protein
MQKLKLTAIFLALALLFVLLLQNTQPVETRVLFLSFVMPRAVLLFLTAVLGFICGVVLTLVLVKKSKTGHKATPKADS